MPQTSGAGDVPKVASALADVSLDELLNKVRGQIQRTAPVDPKQNDKFVPIEPNRVCRGPVERRPGRGTGRQVSALLRHRHGPTVVPIKWRLPFKLVDETSRR